MVISGTPGRSMRRATTLRFSTLQINEQLADYCLPTIVRNINRNINALGGVDEGNAAGRRVSDDPEAPVQPALFDDRRAD